ncbi:DUF6908 domain-containing protein [Mucilaginibacter sp. FT3.2]|uniref:DUF6908 domain-containing protein n=1 Tax=Mucilaginibacter sp. FT3.2 TaxID=2723090 RepID=UPI00161CE335|nr:hypothetical protein [Mucilaginibacter sp. FT3.2]MBB6234952.1 hypothetical protein [Mucilaginibacter sp. FT3.2]
MKSLNENSTAIFCCLIKMMAGSEHLEIANEPFPPLTIEKVGEGVKTPMGAACVYSLGHYNRQLGELMLEKEMWFLILDNRSGSPIDFEKADVFPCMFQQTNFDIIQESIEFKNGIMGNVDTELQEEHVYLATLWLCDIEQQSFLRW